MIHNYWLILIPLLTALTAWFILYIIVYFIFKPFTIQKKLGFSIQGILPSVLPNISKIVAQKAAENIDINNLANKLSSAENIEAVMPEIEQKIDDFLRNKLKEKLPVINMFISDKLINNLKEIFISEIRNMLPNVIQQYAGNLKKDIDIEKIVAEKMNEIKVSDLQNHFYTSYGLQFKKVQIFTFLFGLAIGIIQLLIIHLVII